MKLLLVVDVNDEVSLGQARRAALAAAFELNAISRNNNDLKIVLNPNPKEAASLLPFEHLIKMSGS